MSHDGKRAKPDASGDNKRALVAGQRVFDRYYLKRTLGQGGMGAVWLAHDRCARTIRGAQVPRGGIVSRTITRSSGSNARPAAT